VRLYPYPPEAVRSPRKCRLNHTFATGLDFMDREEVKRQARRHAEEV
jgi:hypothetical protein